MFGLNNIKFIKIHLAKIDNVYKKWDTNQEAYIIRFCLHLTAFLNNISSNYFFKFQENFKVNMTY